MARRRAFPQGVEPARTVVESCASETADQMSNEENVNDESRPGGGGAAPGVQVNTGDSLYIPDGGCRSGTTRMGPWAAGSRWPWTLGYRHEAGHRFRSKWTPVGAKRRGSVKMSRGVCLGQRSLLPAPCVRRLHIGRTWEADVRNERSWPGWAGLRAGSAGIIVPEWVSGYAERGSHACSQPAV